MKDHIWYANARFPAAKMSAPCGFSGKLDRLFRATNINHGTPLLYHPMAFITGLIWINEVHENILFVLVCTTQ